MFQAKGEPRSFFSEKESLVEEHDRSEGGVNGELRLNTEVSRRWQWDRETERVGSGNPMRLPRETSRKVAA